MLMLSTWVSLGFDRVQIYVALIEHNMGGLPLPLKNSLCTNSILNGWEVIQEMLVRRKPLIQDVADYIADEKYCTVVTVMTPQVNVTVLQ